MVLAVTQITAAKPAAKPYKLLDSGGLYLLVARSGSKLWRLDYRFHHRRKTLAFGRFPDVKLVEARDRRDEAKAALNRGVDPSRSHRRRKTGFQPPTGPTFSTLAERWFQVRKERWCVGYASRVWSRIEEDIRRSIGDRPPQAVTPQEILKALREIEKRGSIETARWVRTYIENIFKFAFAEQIVNQNPAQSSGDALETPAPAKHRAALKARDLPVFLEDLSRIDGDAQPSQSYSQLSESLVPCAVLPCYSVMSLRAEWSNIVGCQVSGDFYRRTPCSTISRAPWRPGSIRSLRPLG